MKDKELRKSLVKAGIFFTENCGMTSTPHDRTYGINGHISAHSRLDKLEEKLDRLMDYLNLEEVTQPEKKIIKRRKKQ